MRGPPNGDGNGSCSKGNYPPLPLLKRRNKSRGEASAAQLGIARYEHAQCTGNINIA